MLIKRAASAAAIIIFGLALALAGGWVFSLGLALILATAAWEYANMFKKGGYAPASAILVTATFVCTAINWFNDIELFLAVFSAFSLLIIAYHIFSFSKKQSTGGIDLAASLSGLVFITFLGSYLVRLRFLPDGLFWVIIAVAPAGISDIGAYFFGSAFGRHKLAPNLSPGKSLEGYLGGVFTAVVTGYASALIAGLFNPGFSGQEGLLVGSIVGLVCPMGDLGKSLMKRQFNLKNTSNLIPGHGGVLDRVDTWLWAGPISFYLISYFLLK